MRIEVWAGVLESVKDPKGDSERLAALGVQGVRVPFPWALVSPGDDPTSFDWRAVDERALALQAAGLRPIAGLLDKGRTPGATSLVDDRFPALFARYAGAFAERYPFIEDYTPVDEPLLTSRYCGLYGLWAPHGRDERTFGRAFLHSLQATVLAMRAIRAVNPRARLVQTEDHGFVSCSPGLEVQAEFQNQLRWATFDVLTGKVDESHALYWYFVDVCRISPDELALFREQPEGACPPDIIGLNHDVAGDRHLDLDVDAWPPLWRGGNGKHRWADIDAALVGPPRGHLAMLEEAWQRFHLPLALTEVHVEARREDQLRWLWEAWHAAQEARAHGVDVRAVTSSAAFGIHTDDPLDNSYEPGAFDVRARAPRTTAVAHMVHSLASHGHYEHPILAEAGWWRRRHRAAGDAPHPSQRGTVRPVLITGRGTLGSALAHVCDTRGLAHRVLGHDELDVTNPDSVKSALATHAPWAIVNAAGYARVDDAEGDPDSCFRANAVGAAVLAEACAERGLRFLTFSSDLVFDGDHKKPYVESDAPHPLNVYGLSQALAEARVLERYARALVVRTSAVFGPWDDGNFLTTLLRALSRRQPCKAADDVVVSPTYLPALADACLDLLIDDESGICHLANRTALSWAELGKLAAKRAGLDDSLVEACALDDLHPRAPRPHYSALGSVRQSMMPELEPSLGLYITAAHDVWSSWPASHPSHRRGADGSG